MKDGDKGCGLPDSELLIDHFERLLPNVLAYQVEIGLLRLARRFYGLIVLADLKLNL